VTTGKLDIGFVVGNPDLPACRLQTLGTEPLVVVLPTNHRLAHCDRVNWHAIEDETFVVCRNGSGADIQEFLLSRLARPGFRPRIDIHDVSHASVIDIVRMNYGITIASASYFSLDVAGVVLRPLEGEARALITSALWRADAANPAIPELLAAAGRIFRDKAAKSAVTA
jgi:DNA-binding transcriptional LysR family regulator